VRWLEVVEGFLARLGAGSRAGDPAAALSYLREVLPARAAAVLEWSAQGPLVLAAAGEPGEVPALANSAAQRVRPGEVFPVRSPDGQAFAGMGVLRRGSDPLGLLVWGDSRLPATAPLLRTLVLLVERLLPQELHELRAAAAPGPSGLVLPSGHLVGESPVVVALYQELRAFAQGDLPVLVAGETGVGKEHVARILHSSSPRKNGPFIAINCAAIPTELLEAELFGIGKGVATGVTERAGKFVEAQGGTLLLDEIGDMPLALQAKLLRALQEREIHPLGRPSVAVDVRMIAATNMDLPTRMRDGRFRSDLYYRIAGGVVRVPPLRERREDLPRLIGHFLRLFAQETGKPIRGLTVKALRTLCDYPWPGNVRELEHEMRRLVYLCPPAEAIDSALLSDHILSPPPSDLPGSEPATLDLNANLETVERRLIVLALDKAGGNQSAAARLLGISRNGLAQRIKRLGLG
jgi:transcriptional regulator with GAF, ATPase, and Fis domain